MTDQNFGELKDTFQCSLLKTIIEDKNFGLTITEILDPEYFSGSYFKFIMSIIKEFNDEFKKIPSYETIEQKILAHKMDVTAKKVNLDTLQNIKNQVVSDPEFVMQQSLNFCKQQVLKRELKKVDKIINNGEFQSYNTIEDIIVKALQVGVVNNHIKDVFYDIEGVIENDKRDPIPTGVEGLDVILKGGLGRGELGVLLAPTGVGKTTLLTKFANTAYNCGFNVVQIFFEDQWNSIIKKHFTIWSGIAPDEQKERKEDVVELVKEHQSQSKGILKLIKLSSDSVTVGEIKSQLRVLRNEGINPDLIIIDYVDCILPDKAINGEEWKGDGNIMRKIEAMGEEFGCATWVATQGNRESIGSDVVTTDQMGGSIKKAQIGHVVLSVAKTLTQKEHKLATMTLLKSRVGGDGVIWEDCLFDNEYLEINTESQTTLLGFKIDKEAQKEERRRERVQAAYRRVQEKETGIRFDQIPTENNNDEFLL